MMAVDFHETYWSLPTKLGMDLCHHKEKFPLSQDATSDYRGKETAYITNGVRFVRTRVRGKNKGGVVGPLHIDQGTLRGRGGFDEQLKSFLGYLPQLIYLYLLFQTTLYKKYKL